MSGGKIALLGRSRNILHGISYYIPPPEKKMRFIKFSPRNIDIAQKIVTLVMLSIFLPCVHTPCTTLFTHSFFFLLPRMLSDLIQQSGWVCPVDTLVIALSVRDAQWVHTVEHILETVFAIWYHFCHLIPFSMRTETADSGSCNGEHKKSGALFN